MYSMALNFESSPTLVNNTLYTCIYSIGLNFPVNFKTGTVWLVIFVGTNFRKTGQNSGFRNFHGFNFR